MESEEARLARVRASILSYLARHPDAADTVEGILNWWLHGEQASVQRNDVERALMRLVAEGKVTIRRLADQAVLFSSTQGSLRT